MASNEHRQVVADLLDLLWQMEKILKDYSLYLAAAAHEDGHWLESESNDEPF